MSIISKLEMLSKFPPKVIYQKIWNRIRFKWRDYVYKIALNEADLRTIEAPPLVNQFFDIDKIDVKDLDKEVSEYLLDKYCNHRFDLLGSGWVKNAYDTEALGLEGHQYPIEINVKPEPSGDWLLDLLNPHHFDFSQECWLLIMRLNPNYEPIDWQRDFKSGFRWNNKLDFRQQRKIMAGKKGVDLKVPWELSRLQHLPQMAILAKNVGKREKYVIEYMCQVLDFMMANPIGMGVNFNCPMDIGIRVANMCIAFDLFQDLLPKSEQKEFLNKHQRYLNQTAIHIGYDIEYREGLTSNHYLGNVLGMLFYGAYAHASIKSSQLLVVGIQELYESMMHQFFADGSNFEGSTSYHRLSGEMMAMGAFLILNMDETHRLRIQTYERKGWNFAVDIKRLKNQVFDANKDTILPDEFYNRLHKSGVFSRVITKPSGLVPQFGDNDSGRFFRLTPVGKLKPIEQIRKEYIHLPDSYFETYKDTHFWDEEGLDHNPFISSLAGLGCMDTLEKRNLSVEKSIFSQHPYRSWMQRLDNAEALAPNIWRKLRMKARFREKIKHIPLWDADKENKLLLPYYFEDFQLTILKNDDVYIAMVGMSNPNQHHSLSHVHNDKLHVEIELNGESILRDPGTYLYTPIPEKRTLFRSVKAHNTAVIHGEEQNTPLKGRLGLFNMKPEVNYTLVRFNENGITAEIEYRNFIHHRTIELLDDGIHIIDQCNSTFEVNYEPFEYYSNGYGKLSKANNS